MAPVGMESVGCRNRATDARRRARTAAAAACLLAGLLAGGCVTQPRPVIRPSAPPPPTLAGHAVPASVLDADVAVVVHKAVRTLEIYRRGILVSEYPVVLGKRRGPKRYEGDLRTPEGLYFVSKKQPHPRWRYFIGIDYPNAEDERRYEEALTSRQLPIFDGIPPRIGNGLGIHGNDKPREQAAGEDWTQGCIAMRNRDIATLYRLVDRGTPVLLIE